MKLPLLLCAFTLGVILLVNCTGTRKATASLPKTTYTADIQPLITTKCTPCHIPEKGGRMANFIIYDSARHYADSMVARIQLHPGQKGFMPFKRARLSDSTINVFKKWRDDGLLQ